MQLDPSQHHFLLDMPHVGGHMELLPNQCQEEEEEEDIGMMSN